MASVRIQGLRKSFGNTAVLRGVSLDIHDGEFMTLVGPSGCGKTTLLRILAGLDHADEGALFIGDTPVDHLPPKRRDVAMVFQSYALYPYMSVRQNMALPLLMRRLSRMQRMPLMGRWLPGTRTTLGEIDSTVIETAESLGLGNLLERRPAQLSGGQRQRVALGRAMVRQPSVFLMDEPLSNLDAKLRVSTRAEIAQLHRRLGTTFVYVTHDQVEAMTMSDRVAMMMDGEILQLASPQELYDDPSDLRVAEFIGTPKANTLPATLRHDVLRVANEVWPLHGIAGHELQLSIAVRPEWWSLGSTNARVSPSEGWIDGDVSHIELLGSETLVHVQANDLDSVVVARVAPEAARGLLPGQRLRLSTRRVLVFDAQGSRIRSVRWAGGQACDAASADAEGPAPVARVA
jgi:multiple sugar transport system ATP-binding protein